MKNRDKAIFLIVLLILVGGCSSKTLNQVKPLSKTDEVVENLRVNDVGNSLDNAKYFGTIQSNSRDRSFNSTLQFFETVISYGKNDNPRNIFLMVNAYINNNQQKEGIRFFEKFLTRYENKLSDTVKSNYLAGYAILRATYADEISLLKRINWVNETFEVLEEAKKLSKDKNPLVHWAAGLIYSQVPWFFFKREEAYKELWWIVEHPKTEPSPGLYRESYKYLAKLLKEDGEDSLSEIYLNKAGYKDYNPKAMFMGLFTSSSDKGASMYPKKELKEIIPGQVFALYGFGFSDIYFMKSKNNKELIAIDAGTKPDSLKEAYELLSRKHPNLPRLTTAIITHAHWDHIGGYKFLKELNPEITFYGRENYHKTLERVQRKHSYHQFRSRGFHNSLVNDYSPNIKVKKNTNINIGGSQIELIPVSGGETEDALLIFIPELEILFAGDSLMPYYGEPWVEEGLIEAGLQTMNEIIKRDPNIILHGHYPLTLLYDKTKKIKDYKDALEWLVKTTENYLKRGYSYKEIIRLNLIPPGLQNRPEIFLSYLSPRDHVIARVADQMMGIWQEDSSGQEPLGIENLTSHEYGRLLIKYLDLSANETSKLIKDIIDGGDNELALKLAIAAEKYFPKDQKSRQLKEEAADRLRSLYQFSDPFRFVLYTEIINKSHLPLPSD